MRVGYLSGVYPRASDTFVQREVAAVRAAGVAVSTYAVRRPGTEHLVGPEQQTEHAGTSYLLPASPVAVARAQAHFARRFPRRWAEAARLAARTRPHGAREGAYQAFYLAEAAILAQHLVVDGVDHLHNHFGDQSGTVAMLAARLADVPFSLTLHGPHIFFEPEKWALDVKAEQAAFIACISHFCRSQLMVFAPEPTWPRLHVVHCGVTPALFERPAEQPVRPPSGAPGRFRVVAIGRLAPEKGLPILLEAITRAPLPGLELVLVGDGPEREALRASVTSQDLPVRFTGSLSQAAVRDLLTETDVLVSAGFAEGVPTTLMEAMAARVPVIASHIAGIPELVEDGVSGRLVRPGDVGSLSAALAELAHATPETRRRLGEAGRAKVEAEFDVDREGARLAGLFLGN